MINFHVEWCVLSHMLHMWVHDRQNKIMWLCVVRHPPTTTAKTGDLMQMSWVFHGHYQEIYPAFWTGSVLECSSDRVWRLLCCSCSSKEATFCIRNVSARQLKADAVSFEAKKKALLFSPGSRSVGNKNSSQLVGSGSSQNELLHLWSAAATFRWPIHQVCSQLTWGYLIASNTLIWECQSQ